ncbi:hypothetical protein HDU98_007221 [Podochytrium sp. JEL0797]|nr:hypothetical protein HDU98_007221 [Podochytrium sp. JEL0797]
MAPIRRSSRITSNQHPGPAVSGVTSRTKAGIKRSRVGATTKRGGKRLQKASSSNTIIKRAEPIGEAYQNFLDHLEVVRNKKEFICDLDGIVYIGNVVQMKHLNGNRVVKDTMIIVQK